MATFRNYLLGFLLLLISVPQIQAQTNSSAIRIIMIGAHPDDCDLKGGGTAAMLSKMGYAVKFVAVTNGDAGHQTMKGSRKAIWG
jgi:LmbE family N-acetylglucosaminyl deacetylase